MCEHGNFLSNTTEERGAMLLKLPELITGSIDVITIDRQVS
jgi:hypothetical protein